MKKYFLSFVFLISFTACASAQLLGVQFGGGPAFTGTGVLGESFGTDISAAGTGISIGSGLTLDVSFVSFGSATAGFGVQNGTGAPRGGLANNLFGGIAFAGTTDTTNHPPSITFTIHGLTAGAQYEIAGYGGSSNAETDSAQFSFTGTSGTVSFQTEGAQGSQTATPVSRTAFVNGTYSNYGTGIAVASAGGTITITTTRFNPYSYYVVANGFGIEAVPEPSAWGLMLGGVGALVVTARLRRLGVR